MGAGTPESIITGEEFRYHTPGARVAYLNTNKACSANRLKGFQTPECLTCFSKSGVTRQPIMSFSWGTLAGGIELGDRCQVNFPLGSERRAGAWVRGRPMKLVFLAPRGLKELFSRGLLSPARQISGRCSR